jgi:hypothetical protein
MLPHARVLQVFPSYHSHSISSYVVLKFASTFLYYAIFALPLTTRSISFWWGECRPDIGRVTGHLHHVT